MINIHDAILELNPSIVTIRGDVAYDKDENEVSYDMGAAQVKLAELQAQELAKQEAQAQSKDSALAKLAKLGLTEDEIKALVG
jgi:DeoR/GlpR family transcriptional regulator of sugar metabolism